MAAWPSDGVPQPGDRMRTFETIRPCYVLLLLALMARLLLLDIGRANADATWQWAVTERRVVLDNIGQPRGGSEAARQEGVSARLMPFHSYKSLLHTLQLRGPT